MLANFISKTSRTLCAVVAGLALVLYTVHLFAPAAAVVGLLCIAAAVGAHVFTRALCDKTEKIIASALLVLYAILLGTAGALLAVEPSWDFGWVYAGALDIAQNGSLTTTLTYFLESYNNFFIAYLLSFWFKICSVFGIAPLVAGIFLNCVAIWGSVALLFVVVCKTWRIQNGVLFLIFCVGFVPLYTYVPIFYTDTLSLPFVSIAVYLWTLLRAGNKEIAVAVNGCHGRGRPDRVAPTTEPAAQNEQAEQAACTAQAAHIIWQTCQRHSDIFIALLMGINAFIGYQMKASVGILYIAMLLFALPKCNLRKLKQIALVALAAIIMSVGYSAVLSATEVIDLTEIDTYKLPYTHYLMMGIKGNGGYNPDDYALTTSIEGVEARKEMNWAEIKTRLSNYGVSGYLSFLAVKIEVMWLDGTYYAPFKLAAEPLHTNALSQIFRTDGTYYNQYYLFGVGAQLALLLLMIWGMRSPRTLVSMLALSVFGLFFFLLIWESRSRYLINFTPLFLLLAQGGLDGALLRLRAQSEE